MRERLSKYETPKNSSNSSIPPSRDINRPKKNQSLRKSTGKKVGGQPGRKGKTLEMVTAPDEVIELHPEYCNNCGSSLSSIKSTQQQSRQIVDIPPVKAIYTEYRTFGKQCSCGCKTIADFPRHVNTPVSYGTQIEGLIAYFHARQYLPFARMRELFTDVFNINISQGGLHYLLNRFANKTTSIYQEIRQRVANSPVVGADETGTKVNADKHWMWTWQTDKLTYITHSNTRGSVTINAHFPEGFPLATLVHDGWRPQITTLAKHHQTCIAHLLRTLNYLNEKYKNHLWSVAFKKILYKAIELKKRFDLKSKLFEFERNKIIQSLDKLLLSPPCKTKKELYTFYKRMCRERQHLLIFLFHKEVPPDNNASERAIRNIKVKQKISGQFKTENAAQNFAQIRSIIDTTIKNRMKVVPALNLIAKNQFILD